MTAVPLLELTNIRKAFRPPSRLSVHGPSEPFMAVDGIDLTLLENEILGIVGESGAGKSTLGEIIVGLQTASAGTARWQGADIDTLSRKDRRSFRRDVQMVFQDPYATLDPHFTTYESVVEPVAIAGIRSRDQRIERVRTALARCELEATDRLLSARPHQLSGGQRQRVAIARAIVMEPRMLVADEPVSMLDASVRSGILNLFLHLRDTLGLSIIYISHDLPSVRYLCDRIAIMYAGRLVETGTASDIIEWARHPYARELLESVPSTEAPTEGRPPIDFGREEVSPMRLVNSCRFSPRCPYAESDCEDGEPALEEVAPGHEVRCLHPVTTPVWKTPA